MQETLDTVQRTREDDHAYYTRQRTERKMGTGVLPDGRSVVATSSADLFALRKSTRVLSVLWPRPRPEAVYDDSGPSGEQR